MTTALGWIWNVLTSGVVGAIIAWLVASAYTSVEKRSLERLRADLDRETLRLDGQQKALDERASTRYSWVYEQRAKAMSDIYARLLDAEDALDDFSRAYGSLPGQGGPSERWMKLREAGVAFRNEYRPLRLLFADSTATRLDELNRNLVKVFNDYTRELVIARQVANTDNAEHRAFATLYEKGEVPNVSGFVAAREKLEQEFRHLYGSVES